MQSTWNKFISLCGGHLTSMNFSLRNWEGYYAYSKRVGGKIVPTYRCKNPPIYTPCDLHRLVHDKFCLVLYPWVGDIPKM